MKFRYIMILIITILVTGCSTLGFVSNHDLNNARKTSLLYDEMLKGDLPNIAQLTLFCAKMPKGGDLHNHYSGSIYAETYLEWVDEAGYWIDKNTLNICKVKTDSCITVGALQSNSKLYRELLTLWSNKDYSNHFHLQLPPDASFFNTFGYFSPVSRNFNKGLLILKERAIKENVSYIETMLKKVGYSYPDSSFDHNVREAKNEKDIISYFDDLAYKMEEDDSLIIRVDNFIQTVQSAHVGVDDENFMMRYQSFASRNSAPSVVFSNLYAAFKAVESSDLLVGVNIVGPENDIVALADYQLHMQMFAYLKNKLPDVNRALHAGELTLGMVRPKDLTFHISEALNTASAQRIGHGVDLQYEESPLKLLKEIKEESAIEICFTSNEFILGVFGNEHPYLIYSSYEVPLVICTDDSGVSRNSLTDEYVVLATRYKPSYQTLKEYVYNSIEYSFLFYEDKESLINSLNTRFINFEAEMANYYEIVH